MRIVCNLERPSELSWRVRHGREKKQLANSLFKSPHTLRCAPSENVIAKVISPDQAQLSTLPSSIDVTGLSLAEPDLVAILLRSLSEAVRTFLLHHAGGDDHVSYQTAAQRYEHQHRLRPLLQVEVQNLQDC